MVRAIMGAYEVPRPGRARDRHWERALCVAIGLGYKPLLRYADFSVCRGPNRARRGFMVRVRSV